MDTLLKQILVLFLLVILILIVFVGYLIARSLAL